MLNLDQSEWFPEEAHRAGIIKTHKPPPRELLEGYKAIYLFGNPIEAVISTRFKRFDIGHFKNCGYNGGAQNLYQRDFLQYEKTFDEWVKGSYFYPTMIIRYETIIEHTQEIEDFLGFKINWLPWRHRRSNTPRVTRQEMESIKVTYHRLNIKIGKMDNIKVLNCG